jgi:hypothetical protein
LRSPQASVDQKGIGAGCYLRHDPGGQPYQRLGQRTFDPEDPLEARKGDLRLLALATLRGALGHQKDPGCVPDPEPYLESIRQYEEVGYDEIYMHQIGPDQEGFFRFFEKEILPELR